MKKSINIKTLLLLLVAFSILSCDKGGDPDPGSTSTVEMAGEWYVKFLVNRIDIYNLGYKRISTYNTAANNGQEIWIDDYKNIGNFKVKCPVNLSKKEFSGNNLKSNVDNYEVYVTISKGVIIKNGAITSGGNVSDSIYFEAEFSDAPGTIFQITGYKRTGFLEDEH